jgi:hypothetical protein
VSADGRIGSCVGGVFAPVIWDTNAEAVSRGDKVVGGGEDVEVGGLLPLEVVLFLFFLPIVTVICKYTSTSFQLRFLLETSDGEALLSHSRD